MTQPQDTPQIGRQGGKRLLDESRVLAADGNRFGPLMDLVRHRAVVRSDHVDRDLREARVATGGLLVTEPIDRRMGKDRAHPSEELGRRGAAERLETRVRGGHRLLDEV